MFKTNVSTKMPQSDFDILKGLANKYGPETVGSKLSKVCTQLAASYEKAADYPGKLLFAHYTAIGKQLEGVFPSAPEKESTATSTPAPAAE